VRARARALAEGRRAPRALASHRATPTPTILTPPPPPPPRIRASPQKLGFSCSIANFKIQNIVVTGDCGFPIRLEGLADEESKFSSYEPELFPGLIYRMEVPKVVILVFVSGKIVVTGAKSRTALFDSVNKLYPLLFKYRKTVPSS
jgi:TATA-box binding protein (TBP) (component of TFIID and TFIIIB)